MSELGDSKHSGRSLPTNRLGHNESDNRDPVGVEHLHSDPTTQLELLPWNNNNADVHHGSEEEVEKRGCLLVWIFCATVTLVVEQFA